MPLTLSSRWIQQKPFIVNPDIIENMDILKTLFIPDVVNEFFGPMSFTIEGLHCSS